MSYKKTFIVIATLCCMLPASLFADAYGNKHQVNITGATLFVDFFKTNSATNDAIDVDGDGLYDFDPYNPSLPDQLAFSDWTSNDLNNRWIVMYRGVGSGNGMKELDLFYNTAPPGPNDANFITPSDQSLINRTLWCTTAGLQSPGDPAKPGGNPIAPDRIDIATMDVPPIWFVQDGNAADAYWGAAPQDHINGYGRCPITSWDTGQSNKLKTLSRTNLNTSSPDSQTMFDTQIAWVPIAIIANQGTGLQNVTQNDLQYEFMTGRMSGGENLYACTRDSGSGTRNGAMNSLGIDPSWARGDNMGTKTATGSVAYIGPGHQQNNLDGSGIMEDAVTNQRLGVGYTGLVGSSRANGDATSGLYEILNVKKTGATQYVRPSKTNTVDNLDPNTGWQIGGNETFATIGDPNSSSANPHMLNSYAADFVWNIKKSIDNFIDPNVTSDMNNMPGQYLASSYSLAVALTGIPSSDPQIFISNPQYSSALNAYYKAHGPSTPAWNTTAGKVPNRIDGPTYSDGTTGSYYLASDGTHLADGGNLNSRNMIMGDFNGDNKRDITDINAMMTAIAHPRSFEPGTGVCPEIIGDFTADGNFTTEDIRYFADGLAVYDTGNGKKLDRSMGFAMVDQFWTADRADVNHPTAGNFFGTTLASSLGRAYEPGSGWSKADIAKSNWKTVNPTIGYTPSADGKIDANDIDYLCYILRGGLKAKYFGLTLQADCNVYTKALHWNNLDEAVFMDLSCDLNGDLVIDFADVRMLVEDILGTKFGDVNLDGIVNAADEAIINAHLGQQGGWAQGDVDGDGWVTECDLNIVINGGLGSGGSGAASPDLDGNGFVNLQDFAIFANSWLKNI